MGWALARFGLVGCRAASEFREKLGGLWAQVGVQTCLICPVRKTTSSNCGTICPGPNVPREPPFFPVGQVLPPCDAHSYFLNFLVDGIITNKLETC
jgi:hypothetical protein